MRTMIHSASANYGRKKGEVIVKKADFLVPVLNWIIIKHHKNDNDNDDDDDNDDDYYYYYYYEDDRSVYG